MYIVWMLVVGLFVGLVAKLLMPGRDGGASSHHPAGIAARSLPAHRAALGWYHGDWSSVGVLASIGGAMLLLFAYRLIGGARRSSAAGVDGHDRGDACLGGRRRPRRAWSGR